METQPAKRNKAWMLICIVLAAAIALLLFLPDHAPHIFGWLPYLLILSCPLIHIFMHGGHGHGGHRNMSDAGSLAPGERAD